MLLSIYATLLFWTPGYAELIIIAVVGVLLFGKRLPELGRLVGKSMVSFRKGVTEMKDEIMKAADDVDDSSSQNSEPPEKISNTAEKPDGVAEMPGGQPADTSPENNKPDNA